LPEVQSGYLVVDARFTDDPEVSRVILSWAGKAEEVSSPISNASVYVSDDLGGQGWFGESEPGLYLPQTSGYAGQTGRKYVLHIELADGRQYQSDTCLFREVPPIDDFYWDLKQAASVDNTEWLNGVEFKIDTHDPENRPGNFMWTYDETWETQVAWPVAQIYLGGKDFQPVENPTPTRCFHYDAFSGIMLKSTGDQTETTLKGHPILFVSTETARLWKKYRIRVCQFNLSDDAYFYHEQLNEITSLTGSIFDKQPIFLLGNIRNKENPFELVLGYFIVSGVSSKAVTITAAEDLPLGYMGMNPEFEECALGILYYPEPDEKILPLDTLIKHRTSSGEWVLINAVYNDNGDFIGVDFARSECTMCSGDGTTEIPENWD
jgi:hypothetical protein